MGKAIISIDIDWLYTKYWDEEMSIYEIADLVGCSGSTVHHRMREYGIPIRTKGDWMNSERHMEKLEGMDYGYVDSPNRRYWTEDEVKYLREMFISSDVSVNDIAAHIGRSVKSVELKAMRTGLRRPPEYKAAKSCLNLQSWWERYWEMSEEERREIYAVRNCRGLSGKDNPMYGGCGVYDYLTPDEIEEWKAKLSVSNRGKPHESIRGENNYNWKGGASFLPYPPEFNKTLKRQIRERDNYICQVCRESGDQVHHINGIKQDCRCVNLIVVCPSCHRKIESDNPIMWAKMLRTIAEEKEGIFAPLERLHSRGCDTPVNIGTM